jgi:anaerobic selenocysteine-containing dehydrogenase
LPNPARERRFGLPDGRARFTVQTFGKPLVADRFLLTTVRSHDQFNTSVFGLNDRYRGVHNKRRIILINPLDMQELGIVPEQEVVLESLGYDRARRSRLFQAIPYDIPRGCVAAYFPEANVVVPIDHGDPESGTPASKAVPVTIRPS